MLLCDDLQITDSVFDILFWQSVGMEELMYSICPNGNVFELF